MDLLKKINYPLAIAPILLFSIGYITHLSTSPSRAFNHLLFFIGAYALFWAVSFIDYSILLYGAKHLYWLVVLFLGLVFVLGETRLGATRWLSIGILNFQPSELAKLAILLFVASTYTNTFSNKQLMRLCKFVLPVILLVLLQPDLGSALVLISLFIGMLYMGGLNWTYFAAGIGLFGLLSTPIWHLLHDYQKQRIMVFLNPDLDTLGRGYNVIQSLISVGSGGIMGKGFGHGTQSRLNFLPIYWTDFIFAAFAEEWGLIGVILLLTIYVVLLFVILKIVNIATKRSGVLIACGVFFIFFTQFFINVGMNMGLVPVTGIPLPLISYGGTSMLIAGILLGLVHSVWLHSQNVR